MHGRQDQYTRLVQHAALPKAEDAERGRCAITERGNGQIVSQANEGGLVIAGLELSADPDVAAG